VWNLSSEFEAFEKSRQKSVEIIRICKQCLLSGDMELADKQVSKYREYKDCHYCVTYRQTVENKGFRGACTVCPLHLYGEYLHRQVIPYNGCYKIGEYRNIVKAAYWFQTDKSTQALYHFIQCLEKGVEHLNKVRDRLCSAKM
jgi:hypothetical protein